MISFALFSQYIEMAFKMDKLKFIICSNYNQGLAMRNICALICQLCNNPQKELSGYFGQYWIYWQVLGYEGPTGSQGGSSNTV